jgi:Bacterial PH domain
MAPNRLEYSASKLFGHGLPILVVGSILIGLPLEEGERLGHVPYLWILGPTGARWAMCGLGLYVAAVGLALLRRLLGDRTAAAIRDDGIELTGIFFSRHIPWRAIERLDLRRSRWRERTFYHIKIEAGRASGISVKLLDSNEEEAARWVDAANAAWRRATASRIPPPAPRPPIAAGGGFGRRIV